MDWAVTARTTVPHVRDRSTPTGSWPPGCWSTRTPSMDFGTAELEKRELAVAAVAAVGFLTARRRQPARRARAAARTGVRRFPARTGRTHLLGMLRTLLAAPARRAGRPTPVAARRRRSTALHRAAPPARPGRGGLRLPGRPAGRAGPAAALGATAAPARPPATRCSPSR